MYAQWGQSIADSEFRAASSLSKAASYRGSNSTIVTRSNLLPHAKQLTVSCVALAKADSFQVESFPSKTGFPPRCDGKLASTSRKTVLRGSPG